MGITFPSSESKAQAAIEEVKMKNVGLQNYNKTNLLPHLLCELMKDQYLMFIF